MNSQNKDSLSLSEILIPSLKGLCAGVLFTAILLFVFAAVANGMEDPDSVTSAFGYSTLYLAAAVTGICAVRFSGWYGKTVALVGVTSGVMLLLLILLLSIIPPESAEPMPPVIRVIMYTAIPIVSVLAGFLFRKRKTRKTKYRRRR